MKHTWITTEKSAKKLIIFFTGWGMNGSEVAHLDAADHDVLCFYDYTNLNWELNIEEILTDYDSITIVAYSFGVWTATQAIKPYLPHISQGIAINGTTKPIDENFGIPEAIFDGTLATYSEAGQLKFSRRMCGDRDTLTRFKELKNSRTLEDKREELRILGEMIKGSTDSESTLYNHAIVSTKDRIIPTTHQHAFWNGIKSTQLESGHFPFFQCQSWSDIITN